MLLFLLLLLLLLLFRKFSFPQMRLRCWFRRRTTILQIRQRSRSETREKTTTTKKMDGKKRRIFKNYVLILKKEKAVPENHIVPIRPSHTSIMLKLPHEILRLIIAQLDVKDMFSCRIVSKTIRNHTPPVELGRPLLHGMSKEKTNSNLKVLYLQFLQRVRAEMRKRPKRC